MAVFSSRSAALPTDEVENLRRRVDHKYVAVVVAVAFDSVDARVVVAIVVVFTVVLVLVVVDDVAGVASCSPTGPSPRSAKRHVNHTKRRMPTTSSNTTTKTKSTTIATTQSPVPHPAHLARGPRPKHVRHTPPPGSSTPGCQPTERTHLFS